MSEIISLKYKDLAEDKNAGFANPREKFDVNRIKELAASIKEVGLMYPLQVWQSEFEGEKVNVVVDGERRRRAIGLLIEAGDWPEGRIIDCRVIEAKNLRDAQYAALEGNIQREELSSYEQAKAMAQLKVMGDSQKIIANRLNKSETWVSRKLKAYESAAPALRKAWKQGVLPDDTVESLAQLHCDNFGKEDHEEDCEDCSDTQEAEVVKQIELRDESKGSAGKKKAKRRAKKKANQATRAGTQELRGLLIIAEKAPKENRYVRGIYDALRFALGLIEEDKLHSEWKSFHREIEKKLEAEEAEEEKKKEKQAREWANGTKGKGEKQANV
jgi:ParB/RepB/Spo0J family partition protein